MYYILLLIILPIFIGAFGFMFSCYYLHGVSVSSETNQKYWRFLSGISGVFAASYLVYALSVYTSSSFTSVIANTLLSVAGVFIAILSFSSYRVMRANSLAQLERRGGTVERRKLRGTKGLQSRSHLFEEIESAIAEAKADGSPSTVLFIKVDNLITVSNCLGQDAASYVLRAVSDLLVKNIREHDVLAQMDDQEYILLLKQTGQESGNNVAKSFHKLLSQYPFEYQGVSVSVVCSVCITFIDEYTDSKEDIIDHPDKACFIT